MKNKKLIFCIVNVVLCIVLLISTTYAWYTNATAMSDMSFQILQIDSLVKLYKGNDTNFNGVPDLLDAEYQNKYYSEELSGYIEYSNIYHNENRSFNYIDQKYTLSSDSTANQLRKIEIKDLAPSQVYTYKFEVTNYSGVDNAFAFTFDTGETYTDEYLKFLSNFQVRLGIVNVDNVFDFTDWTDFTTMDEGVYAYSGIKLDPTETGIIIPATTTLIDGKTGNGRLDLWLQVRVKSVCVEKFTSFVLPTARLTLSMDRQE